MYIHHEANLKKYFVLLFTDRPTILHPPIQWKNLAILKKKFLFINGLALK